MGKRGSGALPRIDFFDCKPKKVHGQAAMQRSSPPVAQPSSSQGSEVHPHISNPPGGEAGGQQGQQAGRWDAPRINYSVKGNRAEARSAASTQNSKDRALRELEEDFFAKTADGPRESLLRTWVAFHKEWFGKEVPVFPLTPGKLAAVGAMFKQGGYRSFPNYLSRAKDAHIQAFEWTDQLVQASRKIQRSVLRGLGEGRQSAEYSLTKIAGLEVTDDPVVPGGPVGPKNFVIAAPFYMLRELEASTSLAKHLEITADKKMKWWLPASKTDVMAKSASLSWGCTCHGKSTGTACPYHALEAQLQLLEKRYGARSTWAETLPLFPTYEGEIPTKEAMVETIEYFATLVGDPLYDERGRRRMGGHSSRVTGARHLSRTGVEVYIIQLLARHSTAIILHYVKNVPLEAITDHYSRSKANRDLNELLESCRTNAETVERTNDEVQDLQLNVIELLQREVQIKEKLETLEAKIGEAKYVVNTTTEVWHRPAVYNKWMAPTIWSTACGWSFGLRAHFRWETEEPKKAKNICDRCLPDLKLLAIAGQEEPPESEEED